MKNPRRHRVDPRVGSTNEATIYTVTSSVADHQHPHSSTSLNWDPSSGKHSKRNHQRRDLAFEEQYHSGELESKERKRREGLKYFDYFITLSQLTGTAMIGLTAFVFGTVQGGIRWDAIPGGSNLSAPNSKGNLNLHGLLSIVLLLAQGEALIIFRHFRHEGLALIKFLHVLFHTASILLAWGGAVTILWHGEFAKGKLYEELGWRSLLIGHFTNHHGWLGAWVLLGQLLYTIVGLILACCSRSFRQQLLPTQKAIAIAIFIASVGQMLSGSLLYAGDTIGDKCLRNPAACEKVKKSGLMLWLLNGGVMVAVAYAICICALVSKGSWRRIRGKDNG